MSKTTHARACLRKAEPHARAARFGGREGGHHVNGLASWKGVIKPGQVSAALVSSLDYLPTFASLAGISLPSDRAYDGMDISRVLLEGSSQGHETLFHPKGFGSGPSGVPAMRLGKYKAHFMTTGAVACRDHDGKPRTGHPKTFSHDPPLVFDLEADPGENTPVDPSTIAAEIAQMKQEYEAFWASVNGTLRSTTSYDNDPAFKPCSNPASGCCRLAGQAPTPPPPAPAPRGE